MRRHVMQKNFIILLILVISAAATGCGTADNGTDNYVMVQSSETAEISAVYSKSLHTDVSEILEITEKSSLSETTSGDFDNDPVQLSGNLTEDILNVYDYCQVNAYSVEVLEEKIKKIDTENRINEICVYENRHRYADDDPMTNGVIDFYNILHVKYDNDKVYITDGRFPAHYDFEMISSSIARSDTIEELITELDGWGVGEIMTSISIYSGYNVAVGPNGKGGDNPISVIMEDGRWLVAEGEWNPVGAIRVTYDDGESWFVMRKKGDIL